MVMGLAPRLYCAACGEVIGRPFAFLRKRREWARMAARLRSLLAGHLKVREVSYCAWHAAGRDLSVNTWGTYAVSDWGDGSRSVLIFDMPESGRTTR